MATRNIRNNLPLWVALMCALGLALVAYQGTAGLGAESQDAAAPAPAAEQAPAPAPAPAGAQYVGTETCAMCHTEVQEQVTSHFHGKAMANAEAKGRGYLCEGCHGPGSVHVEDPTAEAPRAALAQTATSGAGCLSCHDVRLSKTNWQRSDHHRSGVNCLQCHGQMVTPAAEAAEGSEATEGKKPKPQEKVLAPHGPLEFTPTSNECLSCHRTQLGELSLPSHHPVKEGRVGCADCHDPHAPMTKAIKQDVCVRCHVAQRGPFVFEHGAISGKLTDSCLGCHRPHGSPNRRLLKLSNRGLCLQCHANKAMLTHRPGRVCWDCHSAVHGSNVNPILIEGIPD